jgi:hypothetical protein
MQCDDNHSVCQWCYDQNEKGICGKKSGDPIGTEPWTTPAHAVPTGVRLRHLACQAWGVVLQPPEERGREESPYVPIHRERGVDELEESRRRIRQSAASSRRRRRPHRHRHRRNGRSSNKLQLFDRILSAEPPQVVFVGNSLWKTFITQIAMIFLGWNEL